jgi:hypothetical protein
MVRRARGTRSHACRTDGAEYFRANAWDRRRPRFRQGAPAWKWEQAALQEEILCLRRARYGEGFEHAPAQLRCQILTNPGNLLGAAGRAIEALELYSGDGWFTLQIARIARHVIAIDMLSPTTTAPYFGNRLPEGIDTFLSR